MIDMNFLENFVMNRKWYLFLWFILLFYGNHLYKSGCDYGGVLYLLAMISIGQITTKRCDNAGIKGKKKYIVTFFSIIPMTTIFACAYLMFQSPKLDDDNSIGIK